MSFEIDREKVDSFGAEEVGAVRSKESAQ